MENNNFVQNQPTPPVQPPVQNAPQQQPYAPQPQQPYGQPGYPQQPYAPQQPRESIIDKLYGKADTLLGKLLTWVSVVLYVLVPVAVLMGLIYGGQVQAMLPRVKAKNYEGMELIRPLYFTREANVVEWAEFCGLTFLPCDCPAKKLENDTKRAEIKQLIASLAARNPQIEANIFNAVKNVDTGKLLGWRDENGRHSFLDRL